MRALLLLILSQAVGCLAVSLDTDEVCSTEHLAFAESEATATIDLGLPTGSGVRNELSGPSAVLETPPGSLDAVRSVTASFGGGAPFAIAIGDVERRTGRIDWSAQSAGLLEKLANGPVKIHYVVDGTPAPLTAKHRTCVATSTRIEKRAY